MEEGSMLRERSPRYAFKGTVHVLIDISFWHLSLNLKGLNISRSGLLAVTMEEHLRDLAISLDDLKALLPIGKPFPLQMSPSPAEIDTPIMIGRLIRLEPYGKDLALGFSFEHPSQDLMDLLYSIEKAALGHHG